MTTVDSYVAKQIKMRNEISTNLADMKDMNDDFKVNQNDIIKQTIIH